MFSQLASTASTVYTVGVVEASGSYSLHAESLDSSSGSSITTFTIPSHVADTSKNVILLSSGSRAPPTLVWVEKDSLKAKLLHTDAAKGPVITLDGFVALVDVQLSTDGYLVALRANHTASIFKADGTSKGVRLLWEFSDSVRWHLVFGIIYSYYRRLPRNHIPNRPLVEGMIKMESHI